QDLQLVIDPAYFTTLTRRWPQLRRVQIRLKRGRHHNEMSRFRFDVFLQSAPAESSGEPGASATGGRPPGANAPGSPGSWRDWRKDKLSLVEVREQLTRSKPAVLGITGVPNVRVQEEVRAAAVAAGEPAPATVGQLREILREGDEAWIDPEDFSALGAELDY